MVAVSDVMGTNIKLNKAHEFTTNLEQSGNLFAIFNEFVAKFGDFEHGQRSSMRRWN